ncbi:hypothetical protein SLEP1_g6964 [Rubroshorea leprosula]|uniref:At5g58720/SDE5-like UBA-like domain-containing protein n=1 Tax=Rubroshorea leprosula TaxID=152421 RepID=A0AAV5I6U8_9ROSI|nr:hypothetical protein SLEP1_g6964 [Rubroshorea leprosula]
MTHRKKKNKKRSRPPKAPSNAATNEKQRQQQLFRQELCQQEEGRIVDLLTKAVDISLEKVESAYKQAHEDLMKTVEILLSGLDGDTNSEGPDPSTRESSSTPGLDFTETGCVQNVMTGRGKQPSRVVATMGRESRVLGQEYARASTHGSRNYLKVLTGSEAISPTSPTSNVSAQEVLDIPKSAEHDPSTTNWSNVVKKRQSRRPRFDASTSTVAERQQDNCGCTTMNVYELLIFYLGILTCQHNL